jgi:tripartite-type tricarboxylate transporter receptor subunit TctC
VNDLLGGHVQLMFNNPTQSLQYIKAGKLKALATTGTQRMAQAPELPTVAELGYPGYDVGTWYGFWGPAGMSPQITQKIADAVQSIIKKPEFKELLFKQGLNVIGSTPAELAAFEKSEQERWGAVIRKANIKLD